MASIRRTFQKSQSERKQTETIYDEVKGKGKSNQYTKVKVSNPSESIDEINIPEISNPIAEFIYNFYVKDERTRFVTNPKKLPLEKLPRFVTVKWDAPKLSSLERDKTDYSGRKFSRNLSIRKNAGKIVSEDNFFNPGFISHTFSNIDAIEQGATDLEIYSRLSQHDAESVYKMSKYQIKEVAEKGTPEDPNFGEQLAVLSETYSKLADLPRNSLGLRVYDEKNQLNDKDDLIRSVTDSLSLTVKINGSIIPDVFKNSKEKLAQKNLKSMRIQHAEFIKKGIQGKGTTTPSIDPVYNDIEKSAASYLTHPVKLIGYIIDKYSATADGFKKEKTFYIEDIQNTQIQDLEILYGVTYVYAIRVVASVKILSYQSSGRKVDISTVYISSRPFSVPVECYEYIPPPEPNDIKFVFDYKRRNLKILWDMPVNPQKDVKQFQVFRRKSIKEPFELIAQYGFDKSDEGLDNSGRYKTGERIDANNVDDMLPEDLPLVRLSEAPVYMHVDEDFTVDTEFYVSSAYIYAICSVDAHGMISNYSSQHHVTFDPYKNRLVTKVICDAGSPRPYPNMNLRVDAFKDVITVEGDAARKLDLYFTPEYLRVRDERNAQYKIVEAQTTNSNPYYVMQLINLDNQKMQLIKIDIKDPKNLTTT